MASDFITSALAGAHKALDSANNSSVGTKSGHSGFTPHAAPASKATHEYSDAPYSLVKKALAPSKQVVQEADDTGKGIKSNMENAKAVQ